MSLEEMLDFWKEVRAGVIDELAQIPAEEPTRRLMEQALDRADEVLAEGRNRVRDLRSSRTSSDLPETLRVAAERLSFDPTVAFDVKVDGAPRAPDRKRYP